MPPLTPFASTPNFRDEPASFMRSTFWVALMCGLFWVESTRADMPAPEVPKSDESRVRLRFTIPVWLPLLAMESSATHDGIQTDSFEMESEVSWVILGTLELGYRPLIARVDVFGAGFGEHIAHKNGNTNG